MVEGAAAGGGDFPAAAVGWGVMGTCLHPRLASRSRTSLMGPKPDWQLVFAKGREADIKLRA
ncbi:hypothetical protein MES4922_280013 [Mesorhizobium ventifaucium]|uniref:Uncharacterized protein n=1 Tax=Mesorhizobium ventifaucium TaxID=666020 RepID=A0ABM9DXR6_9HYPH|nr:hypothetical protein MES4922_280013 [Mesorhizobium ventifaucium]